MLKTRIKYTLDGGSEREIDVDLWNPDEGEFDAGLAAARIVEKAFDNGTLEASDGAEEIDVELWTGKTHWRVTVGIEMVPSYHAGEVEEVKP